MNPESSYAVESLRFFHDSSKSREVLSQMQDCIKQIESSHGECEVTHLMAQHVQKLQAEDSRQMCQNHDLMNAIREFENTIENLRLHIAQMKVSHEIETGKRDNMIRFLKNYL